MMQSLFKTLTPALALAAVAAAQTPAPKPAPPAPKPAAAVKPVASYRAIQYPPLNQIKVPQPTRVELSNGMVVYLVEDHELPTIGMTAVIRTGERLVPANRTGLASILGSVIRTGGTPTRPGDKLDEELDRLGAVVETGIGSTSGNASVAVLKEDADRALAILADLLQNPSLPEDKLELAKIEYRDAIARRNEDPGDIAGREADRLLYGKSSPYGAIPEYETIDAIARGDLQQFHRRYFQPENVILGVYGDFTAADMRARIEKAFAGWKRGGQPRPTVPEVDPAARDRAGVYFIAKDDVNQSNIEMRLLGGKRNDPDFYALQVLTRVLGGGFGSRLFSKVRSDLGLAYSVYAGWGANYDYPGLFSSGGSTKSATTVQMIKAVKDEISRIGQAEVTDAEINRAKDAIVKGFAFDFDSTAKIVNRLITYEYYGYPSDYLQRYQENIAKVTKADLLRVAKQYVTPDKLAIVVVGKSADFDQPLASLGQPVKEIDIAIPKPKGQEVSAATGETLAEGQQLLGRAREAVGGAKLASVNAVTQKGDLTLTTPQGEMSLKMDSTVTRSGKSLQTMVTPMGEMVQGYNGSKAWAKMGGQVQEAPPAQVAEAAQAIAREMVLFGSTDGLTVQSLGTVKFQGQDAAALLVTDKAKGLEIKLYLDPKTNLPLGKSYTAALMGPPGEVEESYAEYKEVDGIKIPTTVTLHKNGKKVGSQKVGEVKFNAAPADSAFEKP